jgi:lipid II:glycine glycyltransferase (peptidoglycan interpeptide bridge formation enzyme)
MEKVGEKLVTFVDHIIYHKEQLRKLENEQKEQLRKLEKEQKKVSDKPKFENAKKVLQKAIEKIDKILNNEKDGTYDEFLDYFDEGLYF